MKAFDKLDVYLQKIADKNPDVLQLPVAAFCINEDNTRYILGIDYCFENTRIMELTKLKDKELDIENQEVVDDFYMDVVWFMSLDKYEREMKYIVNLDPDYDDEHIVLLKRKKGTFEIILKKL